MRALTVIGGMIVNPYTLHMLKSHLTHNLIRIVPSKNNSIIRSDTGRKKLVRRKSFQSSYLDSTNDPKRKSLLQKLTLKFNSDRKFEPENFLRSLVNRFRSQKSHKVFARAQGKIREELDLLKFI